MKRLLAFGVLMACLCTPVLAAKNSEKFDLPWKVTIGDTQLPEGRCVITWTDASGTDVQLTIQGADKNAVTVPAKLVPGKGPHTGPMTTEVDGVRHLTGFRTKDATIAYVAESEGRREGAGHASDIPYFFDTVDIRHQAKTTPRDRAMGKAMSAYLVNFARSGNPNDGKLPDGLVTAARRT